MAESTLALSYNELAAETGFFLGFGRGINYGYPAWDPDQQTSIDSCIKSGLRQFYIPMALDGTEPYDWSFLRPTTKIAFKSGTQVIPMPDDFAALMGPLTISSPFVSVSIWPVQITGVGQIYAAYQQSPTAVGRPVMAAVEPIKDTTPTAGTRSQVRIWPVADADYIFNAVYIVNPNYISPTLPFPYGGAQHAETIRAACLMAAEETLDNESTVWAAKFQARLAASIAADRRLKPELHGYNMDKSDWAERYPYNNHWLAQVYVNGVLY